MPICTLQLQVSEGHILIKQNTQRAWCYCKAVSSTCTVLFGNVHYYSLCKHPHISKARISPLFYSAQGNPEIRLETLFISSCKLYYKQFLFWDNGENKLIPTRSDCEMYIGKYGGIQSYIVLGRKCSKILSRTN